MNIKSHSKIVIDINHVNSLLPSTAQNLVEQLAHPAIKSSIVAIKVDQVLLDLQDTINHTVSDVEFIPSSHPIGLDIIRHDMAHILAQAILHIDSQAQFGIGPTTETGFFYDFICKETIKETQFDQIANIMNDIIDQNIPIQKICLPKIQALQTFTKLGQTYKIDIIKNIPDNEKISLYKQGNFIDLCKGPHSPSTGYTKKYFKLLSISGTQWKSNSNVKMQRIHATAWNDAKSLSKFLNLRKLAQERDHRKFGTALNLFHFQDEAQGMVFWHAKGFSILNTLQTYIRNKQTKFGYQEVLTPLLVAEDLWHKSGHIAKFSDNMFFIQEENKRLSLKPMSCPCHIEVFKSYNVSYKDLPIKMSEFGKCHRNEASGALHGLMRVKSFIQDDAHIFCTIDQVINESLLFFNMVLEIYKELGFNDISIKIATRPKTRMGDDKIWDKAEHILTQAVQQINVPYEVLKDEGAFYGPKVEFHLKDAINRSWQCGTLQLDFISAQNLNATYQDADNTKKYPIILHRAALGTFERFIGILLEHYNGRLPFWLAPIQIAVLSVDSSPECIDYIKKIELTWQNFNLRVATDMQNTTISYKIKSFHKQKIPLTIIVGKKEVQNHTLSLRSKEGKNIEISFTDLTNKFQKISEKSIFDMNDLITFDPASLFESN